MNIFDNWRRSVKFGEITQSEEGVLEGSMRICDYSNNLRPAQEVEDISRLLLVAPLLFQALDIIAGQEKPNRWGYDCAAIAMDDNWRKEARRILNFVKKGETHE